MKRVVIVANGRLSNGIVGEIRASDFVIGVDRASYWLIEHGIIPAVAVGDFDSTSRGELAVIKKTVPLVQSFP